MIDLELKYDKNAWERKANRYLDGEMAVLTVSTRMTEEATSLGLNIARENIDLYVYNAYEPTVYERTGTLQEAPQAKNRLGLGASSGSVQISRGILSGNPEGHGKPYDLYVEFGVDSPGPGHFARLFWAHTLYDVGKLYFDELAPKALEQLAQLLEEGA